MNDAVNFTQQNFEPVANIKCSSTAHKNYEYMHRTTKTMLCRTILHITQINNTAVHVPWHVPLDSMMCMW